jgi:hypothetical protein
LQCRTGILNSESDSESGAEACNVEQEFEEEEDEQQQPLLLQQPSADDEPQAATSAGGYHTGDHLKE